MNITPTARIWTAIPGLLAVSLTAVTGQVGPPVFSPVQTGETQLVVTVTAPGWMKQVMLESTTNLQTGRWRLEAVQIVTNQEIVSFSVKRSGSTKFLRARGDAVPTLVGRVDKGIGLIRAAYGGAQLLSVEATNAPPTDNPNALSGMRIRCWLPDNNSAYIESTDPSTFGPVVYVPHPWVGVFVIPWPVCMDVEEADQLLNAAGYTGAYHTVSLYQPVVPGSVEPYYIFDMTSGARVFVGTQSRQVFF